MWALTAAVVCLFFACTLGVSAQECGGTITDDGLLSSPDPFDERLKTKEDVECVWRIEAPEDKKVVLKITWYSLTREYRCNDKGDHIAVYDGFSTNVENRLAVFCTKGHDYVVSSSGNTLTVKFKTSKFGEKTGFIADIIFTFPESVGCGGDINLKSNQSYSLNSPRVSYTKGDVFECVWNFVAPENKYAIKIAFSSFQQFSCENNHFVEIRDGNVPDSLILGTFCGEKLPSTVVSSSNRLSVSMSSTEQSQFSATMTVIPADCVPNKYFVTETEKRYKIIGNNTKGLSRAIHCGHYFQSNKDMPVRVAIKNLDIHPGTKHGKCDKDKLILGTRSKASTFGSHLNINYGQFNYASSLSNLILMYYLDKFSHLAHQFELCGQKSVEFYFPGSFFLNLITSPEATDDNGYKSFEIDVSYVGFCGRNYSEPYGRILAEPDSGSNDCYTLISAPEGYTISLYFIAYIRSQLDYYPYNSTFFEIYDGNSTEAKRVLFNEDFPLGLTVYNIPNIFSTGNYLLIRNIRRFLNSGISFDANYMITNKGRGCGGYYFADQGLVSSPFYPDTYNETKSCEWEIETPASTRLHLYFQRFDLKGDCISNYVKFVNRDGKMVARFCSKSKRPDEFRSSDNYIKIVYVTGPDNAGEGWVVRFRDGECLSCRRHS